MPSDFNKATKPSWRPDTGPTEAPATTGPQWRRDELAPQKTDFRKSKRIKLIAIGTAFGFCLLSLLWVCFWLYPPRPSCLVLIGGGYEDNLAVPQNAAGREGLRALADLTRSTEGSYIRQLGLSRLQHEPLELRTDSAWDGGLDTIAENTVIVFLALHGGSDRKGAYVLPQDSDTSEAGKNRLRLDEILARLAKVPPEKNKLLILDVTGVSANWNAGMLHNDFVRSLKEKDKDIRDIPNLAVISASDIDQRSWTAPELQRSIFAHHVVEGLKGAADEGGNGRIDALRLFQYVSKSVERWSRFNREALQTPILLPEGDEGERRARGMYLSMVQVDPYVPPDENKIPVFTPPSELERAWEANERLAKDEPAPAVYAPALWRQYQAVLVRFEQLVQYGDTQNAGNLSSRLDELRRQINKAQRLDQLGSAHNTLAMPAALGMLGSGDRAALMFNELWDTPAADARQKWADLQKTAATNPAVNLALLPDQVIDQILDRAAEDPTKNLEKAYQLLQLVNGPRRPMPTEAHFLVMLRRDLPQKTLSPELASVIQTGIRLRRQAERVALSVSGSTNPYSEKVIRWTAPAIAEADKERRKGEDLLFAADGATWKEAGDHLMEARKKFVQADLLAQTVRKSLRVRDLLEAEMPWYCQWLAERRLSDDPKRRTTEQELAKTAQKLCDQAHQLTQMVEAPPAGTPDLKAMDKVADAATASFQQLERQYQDSWNEARVVASPRTWRQTNDALAIPFRDSKVRRQLLTDYRRISREIYVRTTRSDGKEQPVTVEWNRKEAQESAGREGRLALAVLGARSFDEYQDRSKDKQPIENFQQVGHRLETFEVEDLWYKSLTEAGDQIGRRFRGLADDINEQTADVNLRKIPERAKVEAQVRSADRLARIATPAGAASLRTNPGDLLRRWLLQDLLLVQAQRAIDDHWYSEEESSPKPYYREAGQGFATDARTLLVGQTPEQQAVVEEMDAKLKKPGELQLSKPAALAVTSELQFGVDYTLDRAPNAYVPDGAPVFWVEADASLQSVEPPAGARLVHAIQADKGIEPLRILMTSPPLVAAETTPPPQPERQRTNLRLRGLFRGQRIDRQTPVDLYPLAQTIVSLPQLPKTGSIAVRAGKEVHKLFGSGNGAVAIVLDASGSMGEEPGKSWTPKTKYNEVTQTLKAVLQRVPKGTQVSLWIFGQATGGRKTVDAAEQTIQRVLAPVMWDPEDPAQVSALMKKVSYPAIEPWNESPIMRTIMMAKNDLKNATGFKSIVVLTDGMDNRWVDDKEMNKAKNSVATTLRDVFRDSGIVLNVIGFKVVNREMARAQEQFRVVEDLPLPGKFYTVEEAKDLTFILEKAMRQRMRYWIDREDNSLLSTMPETGLDVSASGANDQWIPGLLQPGGYKVRAYTSQRLEKSVVIDPGDLLLVQVAETPYGLRLRRGLFARDDFPGKPSVQKGNWWLSVLQNQRIGDRRLQMLVALEKGAEQEEGILQLIKPRETWIELSPAGFDPTGTAKPPSFSMRSTYFAGYPAPAWSLDVPAWPQRPEVQAPASPVLKVWWNPDQESSEAGAVSRGPAPDTLLGMKRRTLPIDGDQVSVDSVTVERHVVETKPGVREVQSCLVVRVAHNPDKPVRVRARGVKFEGQEHRYYSEPGKYTALFWPVTEKEASDSLSSLSFSSLAAFKRDAQQRGFYLQLDKLPPPQVNDARPKMPVELK